MRTRSRPVRTDTRTQLGSCPSSTAASTITAPNQPDGRTCGRIFADLHKYVEAHGCVLDGGRATARW